MIADLNNPLKKYRSTHNLKENHMSQFLDQISKLNKRQVEDFILGILTPGEFDHLNQRVQIIKMLKQGKTHREIADQLKVGIATVTRGSRELRKGRFKYV